MARPIQLVRAHLSSGNARMNVLLNANHPQLAVGKYVTLTDDNVTDRRWHVDELLETMDLRNIKRGWDNNI